MSSSRKQKDQSPLSESRSIPDMLGGRVRKRRSPSGPSLPAKRMKSAPVESIPKSKVVTLTPQKELVNSVKTPATTPKKTNPTPKKSLPTKSPRQRKLSEMLKLDRQKRFQDTAPSPSIVIGAPHMDSRRPGANSSISSPKRPKAKLTDDKLISLLASPVTRHAPEEEGDKSAQKQPIQQLETSEVTQEAVVKTAQLTSTRVRPAGSEAITYSRSMLPLSYGLLLDMLAGIETAITLLRTRRELSTFAAVRSIVARSSKRDFTFRHLSQLAHIVPEALCVLPPNNTRKTGRDNFILRLDKIESALVNETRSRSLSSVVGGAATRARRRLLHDRLLENVRTQHRAFLDKKEIVSFESNFWHEDFDLESDVLELAAPPLYPISLPKVETPREEGTETEVKKDVTESPTKEVVNISSSPVDEEKKKEELESCIPTSLLERVRARSKVRQELTVAKEMDYRKNPDYIGRLPATMDTIASILRSERRQAFGWTLLVGKISKHHPRQWPGEEIERQLDSIAEIATEWCSKVTLSGPKLRYAFRIVDERKFSTQRAKVVAAQSDHQ